MKKILLLLSVLLFPVFVFAGESSEQQISLSDACQMSPGNHLPTIIGTDIFELSTHIRMDYAMEGFYMYKNNLYFTVFDTNRPRNYAVLVSYSCNLQELNYSLLIHGKEEHIQYSPAVSVVTDGYILMKDWQYINNANYPVMMIYDRNAYAIYHFRNETLKKVPKIASFVKQKQFSWDVISYSGGKATVEIRLSSRIKKNFIVKLPL